MQKITPTFYRVVDHSGKETIVRALPASQRKQFLELERMALEELRGNAIATEAWNSSSLEALQFALDSEALADFQWLIGEMLAMLGLDIEQLDVRQIHDLLLDSGDTRSIVNKLEFIPHDPNAEVYESDIDPYVQLLAVLAMQTDPLTAKHTVESLTMPQIHEVLKARAEIIKESEEKAKEKAQAGKKPGKEDKVEIPSEEELKAEFERIKAQADPRARQKAEHLRLAKISEANFKEQGAKDKELPIGKESPQSP